jgi:hypothetical protein
MDAHKGLLDLGEASAAERSRVGGKPLFSANGRRPGYECHQALS